MEILLATLSSAKAVNRRVVTHTFRGLSSFITAEAFDVLLTVD